MRHGPGSHVGESELAELLRQAVASACEVAEQTSTPMPTRARPVMYIELEADGQTEPTIRQARDYWLSALPTDVRRRIFAEPSVLTFLAVTEAIRPTPYCLNALDMYFNTLGRFAWEPEFGAQYCRWLWEVVNRPPALAMSAAVLVQSFSAAAPFALAEGIELRPVRDSDIDKYGEDHALLRRRPLISRANWICSIAFGEQLDGKKSFTFYRSLIDDMLNALTLVSEGSATFQLFSCRPINVLLDEPILSTDVTRRSSRSESPICLDPGDITSLQGIFAAIRRVRFEPRLAELALPLRRLRTAVARSSDEDRLVDYVIALERLLAADANAEISFRFRVRGAALLPGSFGDVPERMRLMQHLYNLRSAVVHGTATSSDLSSSLPQAEKALKAITLWYLGRLDHHKDIRKTLQQLDFALVAGGERWATLAEMVSPLGRGHTRLMTISACETGVSDFRKLPNANLGINLALRKAGVQSVLSSFWPVADASTYLLMKRFYEEHITKGKEPAAALQAAQVWLRDLTEAAAERELGEVPKTVGSLPGSPFSNPYYWAAFALWGP